MTTRKELSYRRDSARCGCRSPQPKSGLSNLSPMPGRIDFILDVAGQYAISAAVKAMFEQWRWEGGEGGMLPGGTVQGRHLEGRKYGIMKFGRFWRIGMCLADSDIFTPRNTPNTHPVLKPHPNCQCSTTPKSATAIIADNVANRIFLHPFSYTKSFM